MFNLFEHTEKIASIQKDLGLHSEYYYLCINQIKACSIVWLHFLWIHEYSKQRFNQHIKKYWSIDSFISHSRELMVKNMILLILTLFVAPILVLWKEPITVGTIERPPFMMIDEWGSPTGFSVELWKMIAADIGITYERKVYEEFKEMLEASQSGTNQATIANITITSEREKDMDFSYPMYDAWLQVVSSTSTVSPSFLKIIWESWIIAFILGAFWVLIIVAHIIWYFERGGEGQDYFRDDYKWGIWDAFRWAFIVVTMGWFENERPENRKGRVFAVFRVIVGLFFVSSLTAQITSALTVSELSTGINSYHDLVNKRVWAMAWPTAKWFLEPLGVVVQEFTTAQALYEALKTQKIDAIVGDAPILKWYVATHPEDGFVLVWDVFKSEKYWIAFPIQSELTEAVDQALLTTIENGRYKTLLQKYFWK